MAARAVAAADAAACLGSAIEDVVLRFEDAVLNLGSSRGASEVRKLPKAWVLGFLVTCTCVTVVLVASAFLAPVMPVDAALGMECCSGCASSSGGMFGTRDAVKGGSETLCGQSPEGFDITDAMQLRTGIRVLAVACLSFLSGIWLSMIQPVHSALRLAL